MGQEIRNLLESASSIMWELVLCHHNRYDLFNSSKDVLLMEELIDIFRHYEIEQYKVTLVPFQYNEISPYASVIGNVSWVDKKGQLKAIHGYNMGIHIID